MNVRLYLYAQNTQICGSLEMFQFLAQPCLDENSVMSVTVEGGKEKKMQRRGN